MSAEQIAAIAEAVTVLCCMVVALAGLGLAERVLMSRVARKRAELLGGGGHVVSDGDVIIESNTIGDGRCDGISYR